MPYSVSKPLVAVCALKLVDEGRLGLDEPIQRHWPEFRAAATVRHVLSHQAGVVALDRPAPTKVFFNWDAMCTLLAEQEPMWAPGSAHGESALFFGHLVGELVRRVDGRSVGAFLRQEICDPNGIDFAFGLTAAEQLRVAELTCLENISGPDANPDVPDLYELAISNPPGLAMQASSTAPLGGQPRSQPSTATEAPGPWPRSTKPPRWSDPQQ